MRFALVGPAHPYRGGISHYNTVLAERLMDAQHDVRAISFLRQYPRLLFPGKRQEDESGEPIRVDNERILDPLRPSTWRRAAERAAEFRPDLAVFQWWHPFFGPAFGSVARRLAKRGVPSAFVCHNVLPHEKTPVDRFLARRALREAASFLLHSETDRGVLASIRPGAKTIVSPHPTYDVFLRGGPVDRPVAREKLGLGPEKTILFFGNVRPYKGVEHLVEAMALVRARLDCRLLVVGEFYFDKSSIARRIEALGLSEAITIVDRYVPNEEVKLWFSACDVVVLPYVAATQSGIAQIAFAFERPIVATDAGGLPEVVEHEWTGLVCRAGDSPSLAGALVRYFEEGLEAPFSLHIREDAGRFSWDRLVAAIERLALAARSGADGAGAPGAPVG